MIEMTGEQCLQYQTEIQNALNAREQGLDGRARVCARRAAGLLAKIWLDANLPGPRDPNLLTCLKELSTLDLIHADLQNLISHFTTTVDANYRLPGQMDLLTDLTDLQNGLGISIKDINHD